MSLQGQLAGQYVRQTVTAVGKNDLGDSVVWEHLAKEVVFEQDLNRMRNEPWKDVVWA